MAVKPSCRCSKHRAKDGPIGGTNDVCQGDSDDGSDGHCFYRHPVHHYDGHEFCSHIQRCAISMNDPPKVMCPDWLSKAIPKAIGSLKLIEAGRWPEPLIGWSIRTTCYHLLRCVYGSDRNSLRAMLQHVLAEEERTKATAMAQMFNVCGWESKEPKSDHTHICQLNFAHFMESMDRNEIPMHRCRCETTFE